MMKNKIKILNKLKKIISRSENIVSDYDDFTMEIYEVASQLAGCKKGEFLAINIRQHVSKDNSCFVKEVSFEVVNIKKREVREVNLSSSPDLEFYLSQHLHPDRSPHEAYDAKLYYNNNRESVREVSCFDVEEVLQLIDKCIDGNKFDYYSPEFRKLRLEVFLRDGEVCGKCGAAPKPGTSLTIDHIKPVSKSPDLALEIDNLQVLCWECNMEKSNKHETDYRIKPICSKTDPQPSP